MFRKLSDKNIIPIFRLCVLRKPLCEIFKTLSVLKNIKTISNNQLEFLVGNLRHRRYICPGRASPVMFGRNFSSQNLINSLFQSYPLPVHKLF